MDLAHAIASKLDIPPKKVKNTINLLNSENTIPFIARYRKEVTGNLDEVEIRSISEEFQRLENLESRRQTILQSIKDQGKLTDIIKLQILQADTLTRLEDLYLPYRQKRRTRAIIAREKGLEPLATLILQQTIPDQDLNSLIGSFLSTDVPNNESAISGACDIIAEMISDNAVVRNIIREKGLNFGKLSSTKQDDAEDKNHTFQIYYQFEIPIKYIKPHQILAINRGENENVLKVSVVFNEIDCFKAINSQYPLNQHSPFYNSLREAMDDSAKRLLLPSIERDIRRQLTDLAEDHAIHVFSENLRALLTQPPLSGQVVLAIDPGFRTGSKVAVVDPTGKLLENATIYPHPPQNNTTEASKILTQLIEKHHVTLIAIGNGTASRETEAFVADFTKRNRSLSYLITSEAGASVYSASPLARKEFPDLDVTIRGAVSIARRVQDPLAELVKIDPKSIGVGLYQHDINQAKLSESLDRVVESVVNAVGVDVNTASAALLKHVAGIGPSLGEKIVKHREENGPFINRDELNRVSGLGPKSFEQSAGFLRIRSGTNSLDATAIHPESYAIALSIYNLLDIDPSTDIQKRIDAVSRLIDNSNLEELASKLGTGELTLKDILAEIIRPGRDPRDDIPKPLLRQDVLSMEDLAEGMSVKGTVRNVVDFGAFVDIGVKTDGLLHRSKIKNGLHLMVGDILDVIILSIDSERKRIAHYR